MNLVFCQSPVNGNTIPRVDNGARRKLALRDRSPLKFEPFERERSNDRIFRQAHR
ncbi:MAG: hypothetical protein QNJ41_28145 [Xenococcaceae cyanobacterium MO_188.B32]|nr:hypothetical protein [Xenococcaceae cyanobacterium MO_188.B32]